MRRSRDDVFLIGEEQILAARETGHDSDPTITIEEGVPLARRPRSPHLPGSLQGPRGVALAGLGAGAVALLAVLELGGGTGPSRPTPTSSPRSPLIERSAASAPAMSTTRVHRRAAGTAEVHRRSVVHHRPRHAEPPARSRPAVTEEEPEREPTSEVAPVSSPAVTQTEPAPEAEVPAATTPSTPPGPPPSSSGGGPSGVEDFGFER